MRIVIDMQGAQSTASRTRGIGRYATALAEAMARNRGEHEIILALSGQFPETLEPIRAVFHGLLLQESIRVWDAPSPVDYVKAPQGRRAIAECIREYFVARLKPDVVLVSSLFEGFIDDAVTSIGRGPYKIPTAVILFDAIPLIYRTLYLKDAVVESWYLEKVDHLRRADLLLSISEASRQDGIRYLELDEGSVVNISTAAGGQFSLRNISASRSSELRQRYGLSRSLVMYTGGIDHRKNIDGLVRAYASLPSDVRQKHQLVIVCSVQDTDRQRLSLLAKRCGLNKYDVIITGFVPDEDLIDLYNLCAVFVFPSWHEGFGLPVLEAMSCGAAVISSNTSSLPEVVERQDALFDPHNIDDMAAKLLHVLTDEPFRQALIRHGLEQAKRFSWDTTAKRALVALEKLASRCSQRPVTAAQFRPKLAYLSPLPPERSGISDYSAELLPALSKYYEIDVVLARQETDKPNIATVFPVRTIEWFRTHADEYDRVLYHFGNSTFHQHMFRLLQEIPGVVVLHDFYLSGVIAHMDSSGEAPNGFATELYRSHGYEAVRELFHAKSSAEVIYRYPCNLSVLQQAQGIIVHSAYSKRLAKQWYEPDFSDWAQIPLLRNPLVDPDKIAARKALGFGASDLLVCAFGLLAPPKLNHRLLRGWLKSGLASDSSCHLIFVGENDSGEYGRTMMATIRRNRAAENIRITGWVGMDVFQQYLAAADIAVQLRTLSRGETSAAVLDCMNYGLTTIVNANGSMADLEDDAVCKLPDEFTDVQLIQALETLWKNAEMRRKLGTRAREIIVEKHTPESCAAQYNEALERFNASSASDIRALASAIAGLNSTLDDSELTSISQAIALNSPTPFRARQIFVDISALMQHDPEREVEPRVDAVMRKWLTNALSEIRVEPVYSMQNFGYRYARRFTLRMLDCPADVLEDDPIEFSVGDTFIGLCLKPKTMVAQRDFYQLLRTHGVQVYFVVSDMPSESMVKPAAVNKSAESQVRWRDVVAESDGAICTTKAAANELAKWVEAMPLNRRPRFKVECFDLGLGVEDSVPSKEPAPGIEQVLDVLRGSSARSSVT